MLGDQTRKKKLTVVVVGVVGVGVVVFVFYPFSSLSLPLNAIFKGFIVISCCRYEQKVIQQHYVNGVVFSADYGEALTNKKRSKVGGEGVKPRHKFFK